ncbi:hypothetical protein BRADI_2g09671v3 [Brachypodium distachyon]|uniref:Uncharacterized protein n=1 Tax=Brachypodium distachyon TaxID=15368 RepID=A0A2K2D7S0_BRADI|nr:hypothetical protein BRADI_2g09671v3 [Brachypodium distachyon]
MARESSRRCPLPPPRVPPPPPPRTPPTIPCHRASPALHRMCLLLPPPRASLASMETELCCSSAARPANLHRHRDRFR